MNMVRVPREKKLYFPVEYKLTKTEGFNDIISPLLNKHDIICIKGPSCPKTVLKKNI